MSSALSVLLLLTAIQAPGANAGLVAPSETCPNVSGFDKKAKAQESILCFTNYARKKSGLKPYRASSKLQWSSTRKAGDILRCDDFSHEACGRPFTFWINRSNYSGCAIGENIAWGNGRLGESRSIFEAWMNSPPHRGAILSPDYRVMGVGLKAGRLEGYPGTRVWVQNFGASC